MKVSPQEPLCLELILHWDRDNTINIVFLLYSLLVESQTHDQKVASLNPGRSGERIFFSRVNFVC